MDATENHSVEPYNSVQGIKAPLFSQERSMLFKYGRMQMKILS